MYKHKKKQRENKKLAVVFLVFFAVFVNPVYFYRQNGTIGEIVSDQQPAQQPVRPLHHCLLQVRDLTFCLLLLTM